VAELTVESCKTLAEALAVLQGRLPRVAKEHTAKVETKTGGNYRYAYADLTDVSEAILPILSSLGLSFTCCPTLNQAALSGRIENGAFVLMYTLLHVSGDSVQGHYPLPDPNRLGPQDLGKAITYARRYALCAVTGLAPGGDDDDAQAAELGHAERKSRQVPDAQLGAEGRMTRAQAGEHDRLKADTMRGGKAERSHPREPDPDDAWARDVPMDGVRAAELREDVEDRPGSSNPGQWQQLAILYGEIGLEDRDMRLADLTDRTGRVITSAKDLSYADAAAVIGALRELVSAAKKEGGE